MRKRERNRPLKSAREGVNDHMKSIVGRGETSLQNCEQDNCVMEMEYVSQIGVQMSDSFSNILDLTNLFKSQHYQARILSDSNSTHHRSTKL